MPGGGSAWRNVGDYQPTGGAGTAVWREPSLDAMQVRRSIHQEREQRMADFSASLGSSAKPFKQNQMQTRGVSNLRTKSNFKRRRLRK
jgi:hypothetical protein